MEESSILCIIHEFYKGARKTAAITYMHVFIKLRIWVKNLCVYTGILILICLINIIMPSGAFK